MSASMSHEGACAAHVRNVCWLRERPIAATWAPAPGSNPRPEINGHHSRRGLPYDQRSTGRKSVGCICAAKKAPQPSSSKRVEYGSDWFAATKERRFSTAREEMEWRREANLKANNGKDRKDLYTDNWDGAEYKGNPVNVLSVILVISVLVPLAGLAFAYWSYGVLWG